MKIRWLPSPAVAPATCGPSLSADPTAITGSNWIYDLELQYNCGCATCHAMTETDAVWLVSLLLLVTWLGQRAWFFLSLKLCFVSGSGFSMCWSTKRCSFRAQQGSELQGLN